VAGDLFEDFAQDPGAQNRPHPLDGGSALNRLSRLCRANHMKSLIADDENIIRLLDAQRQIAKAALIR
jgi:hypothetical protein